MRLIFFIMNIFSLPGATKKGFMRSWLFMLFLGSTTELSHSHSRPFPDQLDPDLIFNEDRSGLPRGNYQNKCKDCEVDKDGLLVCDCPVKREQRPTKYFIRSLDTNVCTRWAVKLERTHLVCDEQYASEVPPRVDDSDENLEWLETSKDLPPGDYRYFCTQCTLTANNQLSCSCKIPGWLLSFKSSLDLNSCASLDNIAYAKGQLYCDNKEMLNALGPFTESCRNCVIKGKRLYCFCNKTPCDWSARDVSKRRNRQWAMIEDFRSCTSEVINCNGYLRCGECGFTDYWDEARRPIEGHSIMKSCNTIHVPF